MVRSVSKSGQNGLRAIQEAIIDEQGDIISDAPVVGSKKERSPPSVKEVSSHGWVANETSGCPSARQMMGEG